MRKKYYNDAIIGNKNLKATFSKKGELLRVCYPTIDYKQHLDFFYTGVKVNNSEMIYLHDDINNLYRQFYMEDTNVLNTEIKNSYFNLKINQLDFVALKENILIKKYEFINESEYDLNVEFLIHSGLISDKDNLVSSMIFDEALVQYNHDYSFVICSNTKIENYQINNVQEDIKSADIHGKDYIGMSFDSGIKYNIGILKPKEKKELIVFVYINDNSKNDLKNKIQKIKMINCDRELKLVNKYWKNKLKENLKDFYNNENVILDKIKDKSKLDKVLKRSALLFELLTNEDTGGIAATVEVDDDLNLCGKYAYCWTRDAVFITRAFDYLNMKEETDKFYNVFCKNTQSESGRWEQRFYTDGKLAPCWGYQIDETASVVYGAIEHYKFYKDSKFLDEIFDMCEKAIDNLKEYIDDFFENKIEYVSYDLWEMNEGVHLYSLASIYCALKEMKKLYIEKNKEFKMEKKENKVQEECEERKLKIRELDLYKEKIEEIVKLQFVDNCVYKRNLKDCNVDISFLGTIIPFEMFDINDERVKNTIQNIEMTLRTYTGGFLRFEWDHYMGGNNPWVISTLWMALYYIKINEIEKVIECINFVIETSTDLGFLAEQVNNETKQAEWVIGLGWSHAMLIIVLKELEKKLN